MNFLLDKTFIAWTNPQSHHTLISLNKYGMENDAMMSPHSQYLESGLLMSGFVVTSYYQKPHSQYEG